ncbi:acyltransferase family protein [Paenibacillus elgii]|uniref:acyltransferase family protein n=1 Tax=Paenibacillus elgii TaxID=189691 RepID=UPI002D7C793B|nr:acyltransferase family protein [Paenibacillus elgii]
MKDKRGQLKLEHFSGNRRYMPGLDGLRALSVMAVIAYHLDLKWAPGGLLGVGVFFVLSGFFITDQIVAEWKRNEWIDLKHFWIRRVRRLLPAMFAMLAFVTLWLTLFDSSRLIALQGDFISAALYFNNWYLIFRNVSYFDSFGPPSPIGHLWSLAIEEQFYVIWPAALVILLRIVPQRGRLVLLVLAGAAVSALAMVLIYEPGIDPSRVYYGTDTRIFALLIGVALAILWPSQKITEHISRRSRNVMDLTGGIGLFIIILMIGRTNEYGDFLFYGGLVILSIVSAIVIAVLAHPASRLAKLLGCKPLRWIGIRSYSLYIWHYPVIVLTSRTVEADEWGALRLFLQLGASLLLAALSWKYIEEPIRRGSLENMWRKMGMKPRFRLRHLFVIIVCSILLLSTSCKSNEDTPASVQPAYEVTKQNAEDHSAATVQPETPAPEDSPKSPQKNKEEAGKGVTAIGDSVILDAVPYLKKYLPGIMVDGKVGRQMSQAQEVVDHLKTNGKLGNRVIIELGTNGSFNTKQLRKLLSSLDDVQQIVLVNTRVPKKWQDTVNSALKETAAEFQNVTLVDWYSASEGKTTYFYDDGVHLKREGAEAYAALIAKAIEK